MDSLAIRWAILASWLVSSFGLVGLVPPVMPTRVTLNPGGGRPRPRLGGIYISTGVDVWRIGVGPTEAMGPPKSLLDPRWTLWSIRCHDLGRNLSLFLRSRVPPPRWWSLGSG